LSLLTQNMKQAEIKTNAIIALLGLNVEVGALVGSKARPNQIVELTLDEKSPIAYDLRPDVFLTTGKATLLLFDHSTNMAGEFQDKKSKVWFNVSNRLIDGYFDVDGWLVTATRFVGSIPVPVIQPIGNTKPIESKIPITGRKVLAVYTVGEDNEMFIISHRILAKVFGSSVIQAYWTAYVNAPMKQFGKRTGEVVIVDLNKLGVVHGMLERFDVLLVELTPFVKDGFLNYAFEDIKFFNKSSVGLEFTAKNEEETPVAENDDVKAEHPTSGPERTMKIIRSFPVSTNRCIFVCSYRLDYPGIFDAFPNAHRMATIVLKPYFKVRTVRTVQFVSNGSVLTRNCWDQQIVISKAWRNEQLDQDSHDKIGHGFVIEIDEVLREPIDGKIDNYDDYSFLISNFDISRDGTQVVCPGALITSISDPQDFKTGPVEMMPVINVMKANAEACDVIGDGQLFELRASTTVLIPVGEHRIVPTGLLITPPHGYVMVVSETNNMSFNGACRYLSTSRAVFFDIVNSGREVLVIDRNTVIAEACFYKMTTVQLKNV